VQRGAQLAADQINAAGGINGRRVNLLVYDDASDPKQQVAVAVKAIQNDGIAAAASGSDGGPSAQIFNDNKVPMMHAITSYYAPL
jgi:branched-chain amino acid transport system substrate-binding protein